MDQLQRVRMEPPTSPVKENLLDSSTSSVWSIIGYGVLLLTFLVRLLWYPVIVSDYTYFGGPWFDALATHSGLTALQQPFADYAPAYLYLLKLLTFIPVSSLYSEKTLSLLFDILIAYLGYRILKETSLFRMRKDVLFVAAVVLLSLPTVMINSSLWGQSDAMYSAGVMASLLALLADAPLWAATAFGAAISLKLQAIFFAPVLAGYLLRKKETAKYMLIPPLLFFLSVVPAWLSGGSLRYWLLIYLSQAHEYPWLSVSAQSIFAFVQPFPLSALATTVLFWLGVLAAVAFAYFILSMMKDMPLQPINVILLSLASVLIIPYLLPRMHERYFYLADLFSVLYAFYAPRRWFVPVIVVGASLMSYMPFLAPQVNFLSWAHVDLRVPALLLLIPIGVVLRDMRQERGGA